MCPDGRGLVCGPSYMQPPAGDKEGPAVVAQHRRSTIRRASNSGNTLLPKIPQEKEGIESR